MRLPGLVFALVIRAASAIFADEAGIIDEHVPLLGLPGRDATVFHQPVPQSKASLVYTVSDQSVLGAVNPKDGSLVWRQQLSANTSATLPRLLAAGEDQDVIVGAVGNTVSAWSASDGRLIWERGFETTTVQDVRVLEEPNAKSATSAKDVIVLVSGSAPQALRLDAASGSVKWTFSPPSGDIAYGISAFGTSVHLVTLQKAMLRGYKIHVTTIDANTGKPREQTTLPSESEISSPEEVLGVGICASAPMVAWVDSSHSTLKINILGSKSIASFDIKAGSEEVKSVFIHASPRSSAAPHLLAHFQTPTSHWGEVYHVDVKTAKVSKAYDLPKLAGHGAFSASSVDSNVFFTRVTQDDMMLVSSHSHGILERWAVRGMQASGYAGTVHPVHCATEVVTRSSSSFAVRLVTLLSNGEWALLRNGEITWRTPQMLSGIVKAEWIQSIGDGALAEDLEKETQSDFMSAYIHRVTRHITSIDDLQAKLQSLPGLISRQFQGLVGATPLPAPARSAFELGKSVVAATNRGDLFILDPHLATKVQWQGRLSTPGPGQEWNESSVGSLVDRIRAMQRQARIGTTSTSSRKLLDLGDIQPGTTFPSALSMPKVSYGVVNGVLQGRKDSANLWYFIPRQGQSILSITSALPDEPVASIGKVLADRRVLYKYLSPNLILVTAANQGTGELSVSLLDSVSGNVLYASHHDNVDTGRPINAVMSENWFTYSYTSDSTSDSKSRGHLLVIAELYESDIPNDRGPLDATGNYSAVAAQRISAANLKPYVVAQSFLVSEEIIGMTVTQTAQGITSRQLLVTLANAVVGIPRHALDPRRLVGKDPTSQQQIDEGLTRYQPVIEFDPKWYLTHRNEVLGIKKVITSPSVMESTSLVFAYGIDIFFTRVTPSFAFDLLGKNFNKVQLLLTVAALTIGVFVVAPFIRRKQTNALWQS